MRVASCLACLDPIRFAFSPVPPALGGRGHGLIGIAVARLLLELFRALFYGVAYGSRLLGTLCATTSLAARMLAPT